jgi:DNA-binding NarL/FixJ family response regulator
VCPEPSPPATRILIADDNPVIRMGLRSMLDATPDLTVVAEAADGREAVERTAQHQPDVVLLDVRMPGTGGLDVLAELAGSACVLMLTSSEENETIREALRRGARGYLVYGSVDEVGIVQGIRTALGGDAVLSPRVAAALVAAPDPTGADVTAAAPGGAAGGPLSGREVEVMDLVAAGKSNGEIASALFLAPKTVKNHLNRILPKLGVTTRPQAIALWIGTAPGARRPGPGG